MEISSSKKELIIASYLHDVGKFYRFTTGSDHSQNSVSFWRKITEGVQNLENKFGIDSNKISFLIKNHHNKEEISKSEILQILSYCDREAAKERGEMEEETERKRRVDTSLEAIVNSLITSELKKKKKYIVAKRISKIIEDIENLSSDENFEGISRVIIAENEKESSAKNYYSENYWNEMEKVAKRLMNSKNFETLVTNLDLLLFDFLKTVPSSVMEEDVDIPLYDHLKLTAALSSIKQIQSNEITLISIEIGNIQNFISKSYNYEDAVKKATKRMRGRSFLISLLSQIIALYIIRKLGLTVANIFRSSAGSVLIISYKIEEKKKEELKKELEEAFFNKFETDITITVAFLDDKIENVVKRGEEGFGKVLEKLGEILKQEKARRFSSILERLEEYNEKNKVVKICKICGNPIRNGKEDVCDLCIRLENLGQNVVKSDGVLIKVLPKGSSIKEYEDFEIEIGNEIYVAKLATIESLRNIKNYDYYLFFFNKINEVLKENGLLENLSLIPFFEYAYVPLDNYKNIWPLSKEEEVKEEDKERKTILENVYVKEIGTNINFNQYALLYFDLDSGGKIFYGKEYDLNVLIDENRIKTVSYKLENFSPAKWLTISFYTHFFFNVIAYYIARKWKVYTIFSGGDDIKVFGTPYEVFNFANEVLDEFRFYFDERVGISGGILINEEHKPIFESIRRIDVLESASKSIKGKNHIALLNESYVVPSFYSTKRMKLIFDELFKVLKSETLSKSSLFEIFRIASNHLETKEKIMGETIYLGFSKIEYILKRNWKGKEDSWEEFMKKVIKDEVFLYDSAQVFRKNFFAIKLFCPVFSFWYPVAKNWEVKKLE